MKRVGIFATFTHLFFIILSLTMVLPLLLVIAISFSDEQSLITQGYRYIPEKFSLAAYKLVFESPRLLVQAYGVTIAVTVVGTALSLLIIAMLAYAISRTDYRYSRVTSFYVFFTMLFSGGLVPVYILVTQYLHLKDTIWALIIPALVNPFYILIMKGFLSKVPGEITESAKIDGAGEWKIFFTMIVPLSTPALATLGLFISFNYWNDWWLGLLYIDNNKFVPLQLLLYRMLNSINFLKSNPQFTQLNTDLSKFPSLSTRMAMVILAAGPMMFVFPFFQKYFVKGLTLGSLKG